VEQKATDHRSWGSRLAWWVGAHVVFIALEVTTWGVLRQLGVQHAVEVLLIGSFALFATVCVFAPANWLRHPAIARPNDHPLLVRLLCAAGGGLLWVLAYMMSTAP
jgi:hypothetical protein